MRYGNCYFACPHCLQRKMPPVLSTTLRHPLLPLPTLLLSLPPQPFLVGCITISSQKKPHKPTHITLFQLPDHYSPFQPILKHLKLFRWDASLVLFLSLQACFSSFTLKFFLDFYFSSSSPLLHNTLQAVEANPILCPERLFITVDLSLVLLNHSYWHLRFFTF